MASKASDGSARLLGQALVLGVVALLARRWGSVARNRSAAIHPSAASAAPAPPSAPAALPVRRSAWLPLVLGLGGLAGYLTLVGGILLWLRFRHAGLPATSALSAVPPNQLATTALTELGTQVLPAVVVLIVTVVVALGLGSAAPSGPSSARAQRWGLAFDRAFSRLAYPAVALLVAVTMPLDPYGVVLWVAFAGPLIFALASHRWVRRLGRASHAVWLYVGIFGVFAALPVFARQLSDPLPIEGVRVVRAGHPDVLGGLITVRDGSVVLDHCGKLLVLAFPAELRISDAPSGFSSARSLLDRLGVRRPQPRHRATRLC